MWDDRQSLLLIGVCGSAVQVTAMWGQITVLGALSLVKKGSLLTHLACNPAHLACNPAHLACNLAPSQWSRTQRREVRCCCAAARLKR